MCKIPEVVVNPKKVMFESEAITNCRHIIFFKVKHSEAPKRRGAIFTQNTVY